MPNIALSKIKVSHERMREDIGEKEIQSLSESIQRFGVLQPIILTDDNELVAGFRRLAAATIAGFDEIPYIMQHSLSLLELREIELEENIQRKEMTWQEQQHALTEIHRLKSVGDPLWTLHKTAAVAGKKETTISNALELTKAMQEDPEIAASTTLTSALNKLAAKRSLAKRKAALDRKEASGGSGLRAEVLCGDALELIKELPDNSIDHILTNAPFGIDLMVGGESPYSDDDAEVSDMMIEICKEFYRVTKPTSWVICFFDQRKITYNKHMLDLYQWQHDSARKKDCPTLKTLERSMGLAWWLEQAGFEYVNLQPFAWVKPNKTTGQIGNPAKGMISSWESAIFAAQGEARFIRQGKQNHLSCDIPLRSERIDAVEMPVAICEELLSWIALGRELVLDPFAGTAATGIAALNRFVQFLGFELNPRKAAAANVRLQEHENA